MVFRTEFIVDMQRVTKDEESYMNELYKIISKVVDENHRTNNLAFDVKYNAKTGRNVVAFSWRSLPGVFTESPGGILSTGFTTEEINDRLHIREMHKALKNIKWLKKHNISDISTIMM